MPLISLDDDEQRWVPTHVNVTVLRARGLRTKGKQGSRYVYTIIQVGKEKYTTGLVEKAEEPQWSEECSFELLPGLLEAGGMSSNLVLTVMHRVLIGLDVFLGQAVIPLHKVFQDGMCPRNEWLKLHSKAGRKEKERGELQVTIQFTRNNMTASMYDLTIKDKPRSAFGKLKDRVTGRKRGDVESSSAILPGRYAALSGSVAPPFAGDGGPDEPGEEEGVDEHRSKVKDFFLTGKLRKNSDTRSCSSLASDSSMASSARDPFVSVELSRTPIYSSRVMEPFRMDTEGGIKVMTHKRAHSDEASKITGVPHPSPAVENLKGQNMPLSKSTLCINGSHIYSSEPVSPKSPSTIPAKRSLLEKCAPLSRSLQNLTRRGEDSHKSDGRRWSIEKSKKEDSEADEAQSQTQGATTSAGKPVQAAGPVEVVDKGKKLRKTLFSSGRSDSLPAKPEQSQVSAPLEGRRRGWFGSGDSQNKPSPHPVKPLTNMTLQGGKKPESRSVLEKLKSTINPGRSAPTPVEDEKNQLALMEARAQYQNMANMELIALLLQQEMDVKKQRAETEVQVALLEKRETELKKMKVQVRDLEDYIDKLLVRIMEQTPTLLQVRTRPK
ncbi:rab11 family-interacting protein 5-like isoform X3 [Sinocyclocheilus anshuiensis]|uniref:rab11 family-interacting protein 5-like isoform X3 n=1 Tax=Sinocyclocheilus anshuiensis TaxID=1608454 RepID=UPI0007B92483|nr:PREDICTED: rab11 family-interacting protein 5-like isoform X3 [Sinocyclocheilus anshuiensis]